MSASVVLFSGGLDSTVALALAVQASVGDLIVAVSANYGSRHNQRELNAACNIVKHYQTRDHDPAVIKHLTLDLSETFEFAGRMSALMADTALELPKMSYEEAEAAQGQQPTVVPFRNGVLLAHAVAIAEAFSITQVYAGMHAGDAHNYHYADCTPAFLSPLGKAIKVGTYNRVDLRTPFILKTKGDIVQMGLDLEVPFHLTWSCYEGGDYHCGVCGTCVERLHAFKTANTTDPVTYLFKGS